MFLYQNLTNYRKNQFILVTTVGSRSEQNNREQSIEYDIFIRIMK